MTRKCPKCGLENASESRFCGECGTQLIGAEKIPFSATRTLETPVSEPTTGSVFAGRYLIIEDLGKGGMGTVYRALDQKLGEEVALKFIRPEIAAERKTLERFQNELKLARKISHVYVGRMYELMEDRGTHFITMEYVPGEDLKSFIRRSRHLAAETAIAIAKQVSEGLAAAHKLGVINRDLKPSNIMIDKDGNAKIMDFGIARLLNVKGITGTGVMVGTPEYMSPEQVEGKEVDQRSDIYSLGIILYEMVTGRVPFEGETPFAVGMKHKSETPRNPHELNPQIPESLSRLILVCLAKEKEKRYQDTAAIIADLERIEKELPTAERGLAERRPFTSREITVKFSLRKLFVPGLAGVILIAAALVIWKALPGKKAPLPPSEKPSLAILYFENISADPSLEDWKTGLTELLITDLSQSRYINVLSSDRVYGLLKKLGLESAKKYSSDDLRRIAEEGRVTHTGSGTILKAGENIIITFALRNPQTGESIPPHKLECRGEAEITSRLDDLTRLIKADLNLTSGQISTDIDKELGEITTSSPEAYRFYSEGRKVFAQGDMAQSIEYMKKAIALDPEFAMAYRSMGVAYGNMGNRIEQEKWVKKALELSDRISDRERLTIQALAEKDVERRFEIYNKILELYPDDFIAHNQIGQYYCNYSGEWDKAIEHYEWNMKNNKENIASVMNITWTYRKKGMYDKAKEILQEYLKAFPDNADAHRILAVNYLCAGETENALAEAERAFLLNPTGRDFVSLKGDVFHCRGDFKKAEEEYRKLLKPEDFMSSIEGRRRLAWLDFLQGKFEQGIGELKQALETAQKIGDKRWQLGLHMHLTHFYLSFGHLREALKEADKEEKIAESLKSSWREDLWPLIDQGLCYIEMNSPEEALKIAEEIKPVNLPFYVRIYYLNLIGRIELEKKNFSRAIECLKKAVSLSPRQYSAVDDNAFFMEPLARACFESGDLENARKEYEEITRLTTGRLHYGDIYARSFFMLGKIAEKQGKKAEATANYERFLDLWKDADPGLPEVAEARKLLASLKN